MLYDVVIVGAGPAGLSAAKRLSNCCLGTIPVFNILVLEAGEDTAKRLQDSTPSSVVNGVGGAAFWSDRKLTAWPAGLNALRYGNPMEMILSMTQVIDYIASTLPRHAAKFDALKKEMVQMLKFNPKMTAEDIWREVEDLDRSRQVKLSKGVVLSDFEEALSLIQAFVPPKTSMFEIKYGKTVESISWEGGDDEDYARIKFGSSEVVTKKVIVATGRLGPLQGLSPRKLVRTEIGVRISLDTFPELRSALLDLKTDMVDDPKVRIVRRLMIDGKPVDCEFRTFCVCIPGNKDDTSLQGYVVQSRDAVTGLVTYHGSSSASELERRGGHAHVFPGDNLGIMMRIVSMDDDFVWMKDKAHLSQSVIQSNALAARLQEVFPSKYCGALEQGITELIHTLCGMVPKTLVISAPCVEGVGRYPNVDVGTRRLMGYPNVFVCGDGGYGGTRGFLQALADGDYTAKVVDLALRESLLKGNDMLAPYQSLVNPTFAYGKSVVIGNVVNSPHIPEWSQLHLPTILEQARKIFKGMCTMHCKGGLGVIYEIHHFLLSKSQQEGNLHYIDTESLSKFLQLCHFIDRERTELMKMVLSVLEEFLEDGSVVKQATIRSYLMNTFGNHQYKSCMLSLRAGNEACRHFYTDIPVLQPAFKIMPVPVESGLGVLFEKSVVAVTAAVLSTFFEASNKKDGHLKLVRTKIETQQVQVDVAEGMPPPPYCECHVKVNMTSRDDPKTPVSFGVKQKIMWELSGLFEGVDALFPHFSKTLAVSINLQKHPDYGQQFFLTFRTDTVAQMDYLRRRFAKVVQEAIMLSDPASILPQFAFGFVPDAEIVVYDDNRSLDADVGWYPIGKNFLPEDYEHHVESFLNPHLPKVFFATRNKHKVEQLQQLMGGCYVLQAKFPMIKPRDCKLAVDARLKAKAAFARFKRKVVTESTGLEIQGNMPGAWTEDIIKECGGLAGFVKLFGEGTKAVMTTMVYIMDGTEVICQPAHVEGTLCMPEGDAGFGFDSIFKVDGKTLAHSPEWLAEHSSRSKAFRMLIPLFAFK